MPIRGQVKAGNKGLSHVVITDGINFTQTDTKGNFLLDTDQEARFVYLLTPDGYVADYQSGTPEFYLPLDPADRDRKKESSYPASHRGRTNQNG